MDEQTREATLLTVLREHEFNGGGMWGRRMLSSRLGVGGGGGDWRSICIKFGDKVTVQLIVGEIIRIELYNKIILELYIIILVNK